MPVFLIITVLLPLIFSQEIVPVEVKAGTKGSMQSLFFIFTGEKTSRRNSTIY
jgi:hypothetical protein